MAALRSDCPSHGCAPWVLERVISPGDWRSPNYGTLPAQGMLLLSVALSSNAVK
ncbi:MAG TPA: hypothetical protein V6C88_21525 [Chroococcidiopsis sp.]